jgi:glycosyltransferase involved in cell wall biosynthesis
MQYKVPYDFEQIILKYPKETKGLVSIIIPIYNADIYLRETLGSVIAQTFCNWEAILVDDGSTDKTSEICIEYMGKDSRFKYIRKSNEGTLLARKTGLENSRGEFIANLDHDDAYNPQFLEKMFAKIKEENSDFVMCNCEGLNGKIKIPKLESYRLGGDKAENCSKIGNMPIYYTWNKLIKRNIYAKVLFPKINITNYEDPIQTLQIIYNSKAAEFLSDCLYMKRADSITHQQRIKTEEYHVGNVVGSVALYLIMEQLLGTDYAEKFHLFRSYVHYFFLNKEAIIHHKIGYAENFIPIFLRNLEESNESYYIKAIQKKTYIWGAGCYGVLTVLDLKRKKIEIKGFIDKNANQIKTRLELPVFKPDEIISNKNQNYQIIIAVKDEQDREKIIETLLLAGLENNKDFEISPFTLDS